MSFMKVNARFPEDLWQIQQKTDRANFNHKVQWGYGIMPLLSFCVAGLARNIGTRLCDSLDRIEELRKGAPDLRWVIYTNDNDDDTLDILKDYKTEHDIIIEETLKNKFHGSIECADRYRDMAYYRNHYLKYIAGTDYTIVMDLDTDGFSYDGLAHSIWHMEHDIIDCIGSNSLLYREYEGTVQRLYYDTLAYRRPFREFGSPHDGEELNLMNFNRGEDLVKTQSCFGGLALYRTSSLARYEYLSDDCDHVTINRHLDKVYMNPSQIVLFGDNPYTL
jgi:hypothetical protein